MKGSINIAQNSCDAFWLFYPESYFYFILNMSAFTQASL